MKYRNPNCGKNVLDPSYDENFDEGKELERYDDYINEKEEERHEQGD